MPETYKPAKVNINQIDKKITSPNFLGVRSVPDVNYIINSSSKPVITITVPVMPKF